MNENILDKIRKALFSNEEKDLLLKKVCTILKDDIERYDWVGFYFIDPNEIDDLVLGPYEGEETIHTRIKFGEGICGQAAKTKRTFIIKDVSTQDNYLSCSPKVRSEIVIPIFKNGKLIGELDIDSHSSNAFSEDDKVFLEQVLSLLKDVF